MSDINMLVVGDMNMRHYELLRQQIQTQKGFKGMIKRKIFSWMIDEMVAEEAELDHLAEKHDALSVRHDELIGRVGVLSDNIDNACVNLNNNNAAIADLQSDTDYLKLQLQRTNRQKADGGASHPATAVDEDFVKAPVSVNDGKTIEDGHTYHAIEYFDFENHFRGSIDSIKESQKQYLPYFREKKHVLDFGCGRGEFLSLMRDNDINAEGVDLYEPYVDYCVSKGFKATCGDGVKLMNSFDLLDGIFLGQVVEHLTPEQIMEVCVNAYNKLEEGGVFIAETPNPTSLSIYTNAFYIDPSHIKPVHPFTMKYYLETAGFRNIEIVFTENSKPDKTIPEIRVPGEDTKEFNDAMKQVAAMLYGSQDYAVVAVK